MSSDEVPFPYFLQTPVIRSLARLSCCVHKPESFPLFLFTLFHSQFQVPVVMGPKTVEDEFDIDSWEPDEPLWMTSLPDDPSENSVCDLHHDVLSYPRL